MEQVAYPPSKNTHGLDIQNIRLDFPMLQQKINGKPLIYMDSAATSHKPKIVIDRLQQFYLADYAKPKEAHRFSVSATEAMENTRAKVARMMGAKKSKEIIFTRGCTEGINIVAHGFALSLLKPDDEIIISELEHHANIVPWQMACQITGAVLKVASLTQNGELDLNQLENMISDCTKIISVSHSSHVLGSIFPIKEIAALAHKRGIAVFVDGAQAIPHMPVNVDELDCDFYAFSCHKMGSPTGLGVLYGKETWLQKIAPGMGGGEMASEVTFEHSTYAQIPTKFEAGTQPFAEIIAFGSLIDYLEDIGREACAKYEQELLSYATKKLAGIESIKIYGLATEKEPVVSFDIHGLEVKKLEKYLNDEWSIAVRAGQLTAQPLMKSLGVKGLLRASLCFYNTFDEIDIFVEAVESFIKNKKNSILRSIL
jgi:cysteine desulfurase/selenocysteine lyase